MPKIISVFRELSGRSSHAAIGIAALALVTFPSAAKAQALGRASLLDSTRSAERAPEVFRVRFETSRGNFVMEAHRAWSPWGVDRFYYLVRRNFYDGTKFFRVIDGFLVQFGISGDPKISASWRQRYFPDDTVPHQSNLRGRVSFGSLGPNSRTTQLFIDYRDNPSLDRSYAPIAQVVDGMAVLEHLFKGYGDAPPRGKGPDQERIFAEGDSYLAKQFPKLDYVKTARLIK